MAIPKAQWQRRLRAALELRGMDLKDLPHIEGFSKKAAARANRDRDDYLASEPLAEAVAKVLELPPEWFTAENFSAVVSRGGGQPGAADELRAQVRDLAGGQALLLVELEKVQRSLRESQETLRRVDQNVQGLGNG